MTLAKPSPGEREATRRAPREDGTGFRPAFPVIDSKLAAPPIRTGMVKRQRLLRQLIDSNPGVVSLVAPPGYGKTTLLAQWATAQKAPVAWLTIDEQDN